jgi:hypothetical protein
MSLNDIITIRLSGEERLLYKAKAAYRKQSLSAYLRECLEKREISSHDPIGNISPSPSNEQGILLEILLLLRCLSSPEKMNLVRSELKRLNIPVWKGE